MHITLTRITYWSTLVLRFEDILGGQLKRPRGAQTQLPDMSVTLQNSTMSID
jgi:hypothetical protein